MSATHLTVALRCRTSGFTHIERLAVPPDDSFSDADLVRAAHAGLALASPQMVALVAIRGGKA